MSWILGDLGTSSSILKNFRSEEGVSAYEGRAIGFGTNVSWSWFSEPPWLTGKIGQEGSVCDGGVWNGVRTE